jgi:hypothetical protein
VVGLAKTTEDEKLVLIADRGAVMGTRGQLGGQQLGNCGKPADGP